jgi:L-arabinose transport system substrate-binding protein
MKNPKSLKGGALLLRHASIGLIAAFIVSGCSSGGSNAAPGAVASDSSSDKPKIAFIVKQPDEPWFQLEWKFAKDAADKDGFELITSGATDGDQVLPKIENAAAQGAKGLIICAPDVRLGPAIVARAEQRGMKLMSVDDQLIDANGKPLDVHHLGISAKKIGNSVGTDLMAEMAKRGWKNEDTGLILITRDELDTARERTDGAVEGVTSKGFPTASIFRAPQKTTDVPGGRDAVTVVLTQHSTVKHWLIAGMNDAAVMGAVRATEAYNIKPADVIGIGINGDSALEDLKKPEPTGLYGSILLQAKRHGFDTADMMYKWIKNGVEPPKITYTDGVLITRDNYKQVLKEQGLPG